VNVLTAAGSRVTLASRWTFSRRVDDLYDTHIEKVKAMLHSVGRLHLQFDLWSDSHTKIGYAAILASCIDEDFCLR
jgi:hypothetical protein